MTTVEKIKNYFCERISVSPESSNYIWRLNLEIDRNDTKFKNSLEDIMFLLGYKSYPDALHNNIGLSYGKPVMRNYPYWHTEFHHFYYS